MLGIKSTYRAFGLMLVAVIVVPAIGSAQWLKYPTDGIPRKADGKPDLTAPAPRLPDGKPDLSGLWHAAQPSQCVNAAGDSRPVRHRNRRIAARRQPRSGSPGGTLPYQPWAAKLIAGAARGV